MKSGSPLPSPLAERLLSAVIRDPDWRDAVLGDLREEFAALARRRGVSAARFWHWGQTARVGGRYVAGRPIQLQTLGRVQSPGEPEPQGGRLAGVQRDWAYAWRAIVRRPGLSAVIVLALALGLAANATIFSMADALVLRPFRFSGVDRLVVLASVAPHEFFDEESVAPGDFLDWIEQARTVSPAAIEWWEPNLVGRDEPEQLAGFQVSANYFEIMRTPPAIGRGFAAEEAIEGRHRKVVISHSLWVRRFAADRAIIGQALMLDGEPHEVIGVAPRGFQVPLGADIWSPLVFTGADRNERRSGNLVVVARLAEGQSISAARLELDAIVARQRAAFPDTNGRRSITIKTFQAGMRDAGVDAFLAIWQMAALLLLIVACANVTNLLLARGIERQQEFAVRLALGAGRARIVRQLLIEGAALASVAALLSVPLAWLGVHLSRLAMPPSIVRFVPGFEHLALDVRGLLLTVLLAGVAAMMFSLGPAVQGARGVVADALRQGGRTTTAGRQRSRGREVLAGAQLALTLGLLTASGLAILAANRAIEGDKGFDQSNVLVARLLLPNNPYEKPELRRQFVETVRARMSTFPAVQVAGVSSAIPYGGANTTRRFYPEGVSLTPAEVRSVDFRRCTSGFFDALRIPILKGRPLTASDTAETIPVAVVSEMLAERYWPGADPIGRQFKVAEDGPWITVVGTVGDVVHDWFLETRRPTVYRPIAQDPAFNINVVVRIAGDPLALAGDLRRAIRTADPQQPIREIDSMQQIVKTMTTGLTYAARTLTVIGGVAVILALIGVYSLISYLASRRTQEIGVRLAFGATAGDVIRLTVGQAARITIGGLIAGVLVALGIGQAMQAMLFGSVATNIWLTIILGVLLAAAALFASYLPARRAAGLDPTVALRTE